MTSGTGPMRTQSARPPYLAVALLSATALAFEILLTRLFAIVHWQHLVSLAISLTLLGYGASGTFLVLFGRHLHTRFAAAFVINAMAFAVSMIFCVYWAQWVDFDPLALAWDATELLAMAGAFLVLALPFFAAANCIGLALWVAVNEVPRVYAVDLIGAAAGAMALLLALGHLDPEVALAGLPVIAMLATILAAWRLRWHPRTVSTLGVSLVVLQFVLPDVSIEPSPFKDLSRTLQVAGAQLEATRSGIGGRISVVNNDRIPTRGAAGLSLLATALPPQQRAVFIDGDRYGTLGDFGESAAAAQYLSQTLGALAYQTGRDIGRVAILHAGTGERVHQALHLGAGHVTTVEHNQQLSALLCGRYAALHPQVCDPQRVTWRTQSARAFIATSGPVFDLLSLALHADPAGLDALTTDHEVTTEALAVYLRGLHRRGVLAIEGPTRTPPRLSLRLFNTVHQSLLHEGFVDPGQHMLMVRGWNRFLLLVSPTPFSDSAQQGVRSFARRLAFDLVWLPTIREDEVNRYQRLAEPLFHNGVKRLLGGESNNRCEHGSRLLPIDDERPFPNLSTCWLDWARAMHSEEPGAWALIDSGMLVSVAVTAIAGGAALLLIIVPLVFLRHTGAQPATAGERLRTLAYFALIGGAFLTLEITWIERLQAFLGHPLYATGLVLAGFLLFAGIGSAWAQRRGSDEGARLLLLAVGMISVCGILYVLALPAILESFAAAPIWQRALVAILLVAPLAFAMGIPFPIALAALQNRAPGLLAWAWGINGCVSVIAAAATPLLAAELGFSGLVGLATLSYLLLPLLRLTTVPTVSG
jgi:hypothetical protein